LSHIFTKIKKNPTIIIVAPIHFFVGVLELIGEMAKIASLSFRLFGNVFAGEVLLLSMSLILGYILPIPFMFLEVMVGVIQAVIFSMLTIVYFTIAATDHDAHDDEHHEHTHSKEEAHA
jgi:F-type H+-transporting ATPase subunit a